MPAKKGHPNRRGIATREQILDAAVELFAQKGYRGTGLLAIAERVGIKHTTILRHFGTKEDLLRAVLERRNERVAEAFAGVLVGDQMDFIADPPDVDIPEVLNRIDVVVRVENLSPGDPLHEYFVEVNRHAWAELATRIRAGQRRGEIRRDIEPTVKAQEIVAYALGAEIQALLDPEQVDRKKLHRSWADALFRDLARPAKPRRNGRTKAASPGRRSPTTSHR